MSLEQALLQRAEHQCELCRGNQALQVFVVTPKPGDDENQCALLCETCRQQLGDTPENVNHWRCLSESMWSTVPAVQVLAYRQLKAIASEGWPQDLLDQLYLDEELQAWAENGAGNDDAVVHRDCHGATLQAGDTVTLIKDLDVKGGGFTAKRGTAVRNIGLVPDNAEHIEGRVNGQRIVILTQYVKKSG